MNNLPELNGDWDETKQMLKQKFGMLTESDLLFTEGKQDEMLGRLQTKLARTKEEVHDLIAQLQNGKPRL